MKIFKLIKEIFKCLVALIGALIILKYYDWKLLLAISLLIYGNNFDMDEKYQKKKEN